MFKLDIDTSGAFAGLDAMADAAAEAVRPAAQAGAQCFYEEARMRAPVSLNDHWFHGTHQKYFFKAGTLRDSLYQVYSKDNSARAVATYHVAWNHKKAPYGFMVEFGTSKAPAHPFLRPSYDAAQQRALQAANAVFANAIGPTTTKAAA